MDRFSHLARIFDPRLRTHQLVILVGAGSAVLAFILDRDIGSAVMAGAAAALGWSIARELAPDDGTAAMIAAIAAGVLEAFEGGVGIGAAYVAIVALRVIARTTGAEPLPTDLIVHLPIVFFVSRSLGGLGMSLALAGALWLSPNLPIPGSPSQRRWSAAYVAAAASGYLVLSSGTGGDVTITSWVVVGISGALALALVRPTTPRSVGDIDRRPLDGHRLRLGRVGILGALAVTTVASLGGTNALLAPVWLAAGGSGLRRLTGRSAS